MEVLHPSGYAPTSDPSLADLIIINTCSVREKSQGKVLSAIGRYARLKHSTPNLLLAVAGCVAQQEGQRLLSAAPAVDLVFSPDHIASLPALLQEAWSHQLVQTGFTDPADYQFLRAAPSGSSGPTALVTIQKGCDNACSYCIVPSVRGPCVSRPMEEILEEIRGLVAAGAKEVTLIGQNVNAYRGARNRTTDFVELLRAVDHIDGLWRTRFTTSHPKDFHADLPECFKELRTLCPWLHLPLQSGSSRVLTLMGRGYSRQEYIERLQAVRAARPDVTLGTDLIVGFPRESEADFLETVSLVEQIQFDYAYSFKFSVRPGTAAADLDDDVEEEEKRRRLSHLQTVQDRITRSRLAELVGRSVHVLVEGPSRKGLPQLCGRTPGNQVVNLDNPELLVGQMVEVEITRAGRHSLTGTSTRNVEAVQC